MSLEDISIKFTNATLDEIVEKGGGGGGSKHTSWKFGVGFKKGDSYLSDVYRIHIDGVTATGESVQISAVVKAMPKNIGRRKTFRSADFFRNEVNFYNKVLSYFETFQKKTSARNPFIDVPKLLASHIDGENDFIVLEDLAPLGYRTASRMNGMSYEQCVFVMKTLGRFHGVSFAIKDQEPDKFIEMTKNLEETYYCERLRDWYAPFLKDQISVTRDAVSREYGGTECESKMLKFTDADCYTRMCELTKRAGSNAVLSHGDCWAPNFLMRFEDNDENKKPLSTKIIDFQLGRVASPALDISFFMYSCTTQELREKHYEDLLKIYYESCSSLIEDLGSNPKSVFPIDEFYKEMKECARFGCGMAMESLPLSMIDEADITDLNSIEGDDIVPLTTVWIIKPIQDQASRRRLADVFKHGYDMGYLDAPAWSI